MSDLVWTLTDEEKLNYGLWKIQTFCYQWVSQNWAAVSQQLLIIFYFLEKDLLFSILKDKFIADTRLKNKFKWFANWESTYFQQWNTDNIMAMSFVWI